MANVTIPGLPAITAANATDADVMEMSSAYSGAATSYKITVAQLRVQLSEGAQTFPSGVTVTTGGLAVSAGTTAVQALTATTGAFSGAVTMGSSLRVTGTIFTDQATLFFLGGATDTVFKNAANNATNLGITDAGLISFRNAVTVSTGGIAVTGNSTITGTLGGITTLTATTVVANVTGNVSGTSGSTTGNAATATALQTARAINGTSFNGTADITVTAAAGTLTGGTLNASVTASSLTSLGTLASLTVTAAATVGSVALTTTGGIDPGVTNGLVWYSGSAIHVWLGGVKKTFTVT